MNIVIGKENIENIGDKYVVLELDILKMSPDDTLVTAYCLVERIGIDEIAIVDRYRSLHERMIKNYRIKNWNHCTSALEHLKGRWGGELDSFYDEISQRISKY
jgi:hypothetical protein